MKPEILGAQASCLHERESVRNYPLGCRAALQAGRLRSQVNSRFLILLKLVYA